MAEHDFTKTPFSQKFLDGFSEILIRDVKSMPDKVLEVLRRYLPLFMSYRENTGGGQYPQRCAGQVSMS